MPIRQTPAEFLRSCFLAGLDAVRPERCLPRALARAESPQGPCALLAVGKAAPGMAQAIAETLSAKRGQLLSPLVIGVQAEGAALVGDHPVPGAASAIAAAAIAEWIGHLPADADVHIALSGGASALMAAPLPGLTNDDLRSAFALLLGSGLDIDEMNAVRKRLTRWSAGRLALALAPHRTFVWLMSDVPGDDPSIIASGPCHGDPWFSSQVRNLLEERGLWIGLSPTVQAALAVETMKPGAAGLGEVRTSIVARNSDVLAAAATFATSLGIKAHIVSRPLSGEACDAGRTLARHLLKAQALSSTPGILALPAPRPPELWLYGGETVVTLAGATGTGGRNQELALAAAQEVASQYSSGENVLLAAGTDGRDGSTVAAGAVVDGRTWHKITASGRDPATDLARHAAHDALEAAHALVTTGHTGTNVMDVVLALSDKWRHLYAPEECTFDRTQ